VLVCVQKLIAYVFYPITFLMGFELADCFLAARLLGVKLLTTTTVRLTHTR
jgi:nucleoside permease NupC